MPSFKLFMAYPNVLMVDDATIFQALSRTAKNGALICMHAENGGVIDVIRSPSTAACRASTRLVGVENQEGKTAAG